MALVLTGSFLILLAAFAVLSEYALRGSEDQTRHQYLVIAQLTAAQVDGEMNDAKEELQQAADTIAQAPPTESPQQAVNIAERRMAPFAIELALVDPSGHSLATAPDAGASIDTSSASFAGTVSGAAAAVSDPYKDARSGRPAVDLGVSLTRDGQSDVLLGVFALDSQPILQALAHAVQVGKTGHAGLLDAHGRVLVSTYGLPFESAGEHPAFFQEAMTAKRDEVKTVPFVLDLPGETRGEQHLMAAAMMRQAPWGVDIGGDASEAFAAERHLRFGLVIIGTSALVLIWAGSLWGTRVLVRPVYDLTAAAQRIAAGDLSVPLAAGAGGEIGAMADSLERMRRRLLQTIDSLEELRATLEARVDERTEALRNQEDQVRRLLHQVITAQEEERARLAYELHDEVGQLLTAVRFAVDSLPGASPDGEVTAKVVRVQELVDRAMADLRLMIGGLRPGALDQFGLEPALREVADQLLAPLNIGVVIESDIPSRLPPEVEVVLFRIAQEAMHNIARHSGATAMTLRIRLTEGEVTMQLHDDGRGFDPAALSVRGSGQGLGLAGMRERASLLGGTVRVESAPGQGTTVEARLPVDAASMRRDVGVGSDRSDV